MSADHSMPAEAPGAKPAVLNGLNFFNWYHMDGYIDYILTGSDQGKEVAFSSTFWGKWSDGQDYTPIEIEAFPKPSKASSDYDFPCNDASDNPRIFYCGSRRTSDDSSSSSLMLGAAQASHLLLLFILLMLLYY